MAKIDSIKINVNGKDFEYNINVGKTGVFKCNIDYHVAKIIGIENSTVQHSTLQEVKNAILNPYHKYLKSTSTYESFIGISYKASGRFMQNNEGHYLFGRNNSNQDFYDNATRFGIGSSLVFGFAFYIKESCSTGLEIWYKAKKVNPEYKLNTFEKRHENFIFSSTTHKAEGKLIKWSQDAKNTLKQGEENLRKISELLFNFINQDELLIQSSLSKGNLLNQ